MTWYDEEPFPKLVPIHDWRDLPGGDQDHLFSILESEFRQDMDGLSPWEIDDLWNDKLVRENYADEWWEKNPELQPMRNRKTKEIVWP